MHWRHDWQSVAVELTEEVKFFKKTGQRLGDEGDVTPFTEVLQRCSRCPKLRTVSLVGHWTLEQVKA